MFVICNLVCICMCVCVDGLYSRGRNKRGMLISGVLGVGKTTKSYFMGSLHQTRGSKKHTITCLRRSAHSKFTPSSYCEKHGG